MKRPVIIGIALILLAGAMMAFAYRVAIREVIADAGRPDLPEAKPYVPPSVRDDEAEEPEPFFPEPARLEADTDADLGETEKETEEDPALIIHDDEADTAVLAGAMNLAVPFSPQAPHADWNLPFQEACEETSLIMVNAWMVGTPPGLIEPDVAEGLILDVVAWQEERFGYYEDTSAEETAIIAREFYGYENTVVLPVTSIEDVKAQLAAGHAVILPASGRDLHNEYFRGEGPLYHMLVVKGFTEDGRIISNDPGTRRGEDYLYDPDVLFNAIGDWNDGDPANGEKLMIVVKP